MKIVFHSLRLINFKGKSDLSIDFNLPVTRISGRNGIGKTTICDAVSWCLTGKDAKGNTSFGIKTRDSKGNDIPHLKHSVSLDLEIDGMTYNLTRTLCEKWSKPRGSFEEVLTGNYIEYYVNGQKVTATDYNSFLSSRVPENIFRVLTVQTAFTSMHWNDQRSMLSSIVGECTPEEIAEGNPLYDELVKELAVQSMEQYRKHLSYQIRELKKKIDEIPVRLSTLNSTLPECLAWDDIKKQIEQKQAEYTRLQNEIQQIKSGNQDNVFRSQMKSRIQFTEKRLDEMRKSKRLAATEAYERYDNDLRNAKTLLRDAEATKDQLNRKRISIDKLIDQCNIALRENEAQRTMFNTEWEQMRNMHFDVDTEALTICPTCGQYLPEEQARTAIDNARNAFNEKKAQIKAKLLARAEELKRIAKEASDNKETYIEELKLTDENATNAAKSVLSAKKHLEEIEKEVPKTAEQLLEEDTNYLKVVEELNTLHEELENGTSDTLPSDATTEMYSAIHSLEQEIKELNTQYASRSQYEKVSKLIAETEEQKSILAQQLTELERKEDIAIQFVDRQDTILEQRVNSLFKITKFQLFKRQVDGTKIPNCIATHDGVEYNDLNKAMKLAVSLDIIEGLATKWDCFLPICIDNAESYNTIPPTTGQQIQLYVSQDNVLRIND